MSEDDLYQAALVALAREASGAGALEAPSGAATRDNPLCGDRVTVQVRVVGGRVAALAHRVRGCLLCEAAASLLGRAAPGLAPAELEAARGDLAALLKEGRPVPPAGGAAGTTAMAAALREGLRTFSPVRAVPSRHSCVLLPFDALLAALAASPPTSPR